MNKRFLKQHFNDASGNLYEAYLGDVDQRMDQDNGDDLSQSDRLRLFAATQVKDPKVRWEELQRVLDVDRFASFLAMEMLLAHWDGYGLHTNNYRIYHDPRTDRMVFIAHGLDGVFKRSHVSVKPPLRSVVGRAFLQTPAGQAFYQRRLETLFTNVFRPDVLTNRLQVAVDHLRRGGLKPAEVAAVEKNAEALEKRMLARLESVRSQLAGVPPSLLEFNAQGVAFLSGWREERDIGDPKMEITRNEVRSLRIQAIDGEETVASWRTSVYLRQGWYRFEGRVSTQNLVSRMGRGAALRISGEQRVPVLAGTTSWQPMVYAFRVAEDSDVELVCEVRATVGEALFDLGSLRLKAGANHAAGTASE